MDARARATSIPKLRSDFSLICNFHFVRNKIFSIFRKNGELIGKFLLRFWPDFSFKKSVNQLPPHIFGMETECNPFDSKSLHRNYGACIWSHCYQMALLCLLGYFEKSASIFYAQNFICLRQYLTFILNFFILHHSN